MKRNESEIFFALMRKKCFFCLVRIDAKLRNLKRNKMARRENKTKKKRKTAIIFTSKRNEVKRKQTTAIIFTSKRNEEKQKQNFFSLPCEKSGFFLLVFASEAKRK
jgi:hypothetical protein